MKYMKKASVALLAGFLTFSGQAMVFADGEVENVEKQEEVKEIVLTLDAVKQMLLENNTNLIIMETNIEKKKYENAKLKRDMRDVDEDLEDIADEREQGGNNLGLSQEKGQLLNSEDQLIEALAQIENGLVISDLTKQQAKDALQLQAANVYVALLNMQEQMELLDKSIVQAKKDIRIAEIRESVGLISSYDVDQLERELEAKQKSKTDLQTEYDNQIAKLSIDLNIPVGPEIVLQPLEVEEMTEMELPENISELIENSYAMKTAKEELALLQYYAEELDTLYERNKNEYDLELKQAEIAKLEKDLHKAIEAAYHNVNQAYSDVKNAQDKLEYAKDDYEKLGLKYSLGLASKYQYEQGELAIEQAEQALANAKNSYVLAQEQIKAIENGLINT